MSQLTAEAPSLRTPRVRGRVTIPWRTLVSSRLALMGSAIVALFLLCGVTGIVLLYVPGLKHLWTDQDLEAVLKPPGTSGHLLGTDELGRDTLWRLLSGMGISLEIGLAVTAMTVLIGLVLGLVAGYFGGLVDWLISALTDVTWGFPLILLAVVLAGIMNPGQTSIIIAVGALNWAGFARIIRGYALSIREREFVEAARSLGIPGWRILARHLVPNVVPATLVMASYYIAVTIIVEAGVSFIGLGVQSPTPSLGQLIADGRNYLGLTVWPAFIPGITIAVAVLGFNLLGDGLRDLLDPRLSKPQA